MGWINKDGKPEINKQQIEEWLEQLRSNEAAAVADEMEDFLGSLEIYENTRILPDRR